MSSLSKHWQYFGTVQFMINKMLKQNSQTFGNIWSTFFICNFSDFWQKFVNFSTTICKSNKLTKVWQNFEQQNAKNNKLIKVWQNFAKFLCTSPLLEFWQKFGENIVKKCQFHDSFMKLWQRFVSCVFFHAISLHHI